MINSIYYFFGMFNYLLVSVPISYVFILYKKAVWTDLSIIAFNSIAFLIGIIQVEYLRRKDKLIDYDTRLSETNDIDDAMDKHRERQKKSNKMTD